MDTAILTAVLTAILTVGFGLLAFEYQQKWNKKLAIYEEIIERLIEIKSLASRLSLEATRDLSHAGLLASVIEKHRILEDKISNLVYRKPVYELVLTKDVTRALEHLRTFLMFKCMMTTQSLGFSDTFKGDKSHKKDIYERYVEILRATNNFMEELTIHIKSDLNIIRKPGKAYAFLKERFRKYIIEGKN